MRTPFALAALGFLALAFASFSLVTHTASAANVPIEAGNFYFCDEAHEGQVCTTNVNAGDTVTWTVEAGSHEIAQCTDNTFASCTGGFNSGPKGANSTFAQTFASAGTTFYRCDFHPTEMRGQIVAAAQVTPSPSPTAAASGSPTAAATSTPTSAALPQTGGAPSDGGYSISMYLALVIGAMLLAASGVTFALARKRA